MTDEITDVKPPKGFPHIRDLTGSEATILQLANEQGDILGYATMEDIDAYIEKKVSETIHSFTQKQTFQDVTINGTFDGNSVVNVDKLNGALTNYEKVFKFENWGDYEKVFKIQTSKELAIDLDSITISMYDRFGLSFATFGAYDHTKVTLNQYLLNSLGIYYKENNTNTYYINARCFLTLTVYTSKSLGVTVTEVSDIPSDFVSVSTSPKQIATKSDLAKYAPIVTSGNGAFDGLVKPYEAWLVIGTRISVAESIVLVINNYNGTISVNQIFATANMSYVTNEQGTVQLYYAGSDIGIFSGAIRLN